MKEVAAQIEYAKQYFDKAKEVARKHGVDVSPGARCMYIVAILC